MGIYFSDPPPRRGYQWWKIDRASKNRATRRAALFGTPPARRWSRWYDKEGDAANVAGVECILWLDDARERGEKKGGDFSPIEDLLLHSDADRFPNAILLDVLKQALEEAVQNAKNAAKDAEDYAKKASK